MSRRQIKRKVKLFQNRLKVNEILNGPRYQDKLKIKKQPERTERTRNDDPGAGRGSGSEGGARGDRATGKDGHQVAGSVERADPEGGTRKGLTPRGSGDRIRLLGFSCSLLETGFSR
jgi:hypothetical protein